MIHLTLQQLSAFLDGELTEASTEIVRRHLVECADCTLKFAALENLDEELGALASDPGKSFFEELADSVDRATRTGPDRSAAKPAAKSEEKRAPREGRVKEPPAPRRREDDHAEPTPRSRAWPAWGSAAVLVVLAGSLGIMGVRSGRLPSLRGNRAVVAPTAPQPIAEPPALPASEPAPAPTTQPEPALEDSTTRLAEAPVPASVPSTAPPPPRTAPAPSPAAPRRVEADSHLPAGPAKSLVPVIRTRTVVETLVVDRGSGPPAAAAPEAPAKAAPAEAPAKAAEKRLRATPNPSAKPDPLASLEGGALRAAREAERRSAEAATEASAPRFDIAAAAWEEVLPMVRGTLHEVTIRQRVADAKYRAWQASPDAYRASGATAALRSYLMFAKTDSDREEAKARLQAIRR